MGDDAPTRADEAGGASSRRHLLSLLGASGAALVVSQAATPSAGAGHDSTNVLHLGESNTAPGDAATAIAADVEGPGLSVDNVSTLDAVGVRGSSPVIGVEGTSAAGFGVVGRRTSSDDGDGNAGVFGHAQNGSGVQGSSVLGPGVQGSSEGSVGVMGFGAFGVDDPSVGVLGLGFSDHGVLGQTEQPDKAGVRGEAHSCLERGSEDPEDPCSQPSLGTGVQGVAQAGIGVRGESDTGPGVEAQSNSGLALRVLGRAGFSTAGTGTVPQGASSTFVTNALVNAASHVMVVLTSNPGTRQLHYVVPAAGGFTVHLTAAPAKQRPATTFSYLAVQSA